MREFIEIEAKQLASETEMEQFAGYFYRTYLQNKKRVILLLDGEPGSGKTTFCRYLSGSLGITTVVNSPTFNLLNIHPGSNGTLFHYDLYRLTAAAQIEELGFVEYWNGDTSNTIEHLIEPEVHAIEWWSRACEMIPFNESCYMLQFTEGENENARTISILR